ncbi:MAG: hypothetical protein RBQ90_05985 [Bacteroidales bacterium]|jgi:L-fucose isomerase-like protein|nr:hypothetical protein [Bacteroidales bacterium]
METPKLKLELVFFHSPIHDFHVLVESRKTMLESLEERFRVSVISYRSISVDHFSDDTKIYIPFIASGGCEEIFQSNAYMLPLPLIFLYDHLHNSLPAALELTTYFSRGRLHVPMIFSEKELRPETMEIFFRMQHTVRKLKKTRIALIGGPSPWLLSSGVDFDAFTRMFGIHFEHISIQSLANSFNEHTKLSLENQALYKKILKQATKLTGCTSEDVYDSVRMYQALDDLMVYHSCNAVTVKCFDLVPECKVTACNALSLLNRSGIPAACEGDVHSLLGMVFAGELTNQPVFMANPVFFDRENNTMDVAHCSIPLSMTETYGFNTHFETGISVGIEGCLKPGESYTAVKWMGEKMERFFVSEGISLASEHQDYKCRTQMRFSMEEPLDTFHFKGMGNHILLVKGKHYRTFRDWDQYMIYRR